VNFRDLFSERAALYSRFRPRYPDELFDFIASLSPSRALAWDCATGNGQAAIGLASRFTRVIATDASEQQIANAMPHPAIEYRVATANESGLASGSADAVAVAQALHWFDVGRFYDEARRVLRPDGAIVVWGYGDPVVDDARLNGIVHEYNRVTVEKFWQPERQILLEGYRALTFPFHEVDAPALTLENYWTLDEFAGLLRTWSATASYAAHIGRDPVADVERMLEPLWGKREERHLVEWPLFIRAGISR
jgi:SAM-dependent methyltransferase